MLLPSLLSPTKKKSHEIFTVLRKQRMRVYSVLMFSFFVDAESIDLCEDDRKRERGREKEKSVPFF